jgi:glycosyltransferase involved in cell wall biosynthesis
VDGPALSSRRNAAFSVAQEERVKFSIVCLSPQEWHVDLPTNRQQIMRRAAALGHQVLFIETGHFLGTHLWRLLRSGDRGSLARRLASRETVSQGVLVRKALNLLPWREKYAVANRFDCWITAKALRRAVRRLPKPVVLWLYDPCSARMAGTCGEDLAVYDCVDDYAAQVGPDRLRRSLAVAEDQRAARRARLVFATTTGLFRRMRLINGNTRLVPNAGDFGHFNAAADRAFAPAEVGDLARPVLGFAGNFLAAKVDLGLIENVALARPDWTLLLVGPARPETADALAGLARLPNVHWVGFKPYGDLPGYVAAFDVALIPYVANDYTRNCFPLKLYEYLAAGKPVIASGLPELAGMEPDVVLTTGLEEFVAAVESALRLREDGDRRRRVDRAARNTWELRTERLLDLVASELDTGMRCGS